MKDIESVVMGSAPDAFDGVHMKGEYLLEGSGGIGRPNSRVYVGGGTRVFAPIGGWWHVASGLFDTCLVVAEEKMSPLHPHPQSAFWSIFDHTTERPLGVTLLPDLRAGDEEVHARAQREGRGRSPWSRSRTR